MFKIIILSVILLFSITCLSQSNFEKGYFVDNNGLKTNCYIQNEDWLTMPSEFKYKMSEDEKIKKADINDVKEFAIINADKFIRTNVDIDTSSDVLKNLSIVKYPLWRNKQIFLKVLVEGKASLYIYNSQNYKRFFYAVADTVVKQLIFKEYFFNDQQTSLNYTFRQQLFSDIVCPHTSVISVSNINYKQKELEKYFHHYNSCMDTSYKIVTPKVVKGEFNLRILAGISFSAISVSNDYVSYADVNFGNKIRPTFSFEMEYIPSFRNYHWGVLLGAAYYSYKAQKYTNIGDVVVDLKTIDLFLGIKRYFFLNEYSRIFVDFGVNSLAEYCQGSTVGYRPKTSKLDYAYLDITSYNPIIFLGLGLEYKRYFAELRYFSNQNILSHFPNWDSKYEKLTLNFGYKILKSK